jgi:predicted RNA-binding protein with TRAM domain
MPAPESSLKVGDEYKVTIEAMSSKTDGLARIKGFLVFVENAEPGQEIKIKITEVKQRFAMAKRV